MTIEWLAGNRIRGTNTERTTTTGFNSGLSGAGGWKEVGRTTLGSANATISVTGLDNKKYYMILGSRIGSSGGMNVGVQLNADTGSNYAYRRSGNGGTDDTLGSASNMEGLSTGTTPAFEVAYLANLSTKEKLSIRHHVAQNTAGAGTAPYRAEMVGKWANTSDAVSSYQWITANSATFNSGSEVVVLGWDPTDSHTTNFWEELASVNLSGGVSDTLDSGTITAKKYLWVQFYVKSVTGVTRPTLRLNSDTGSNYANRESLNGAADATNTSVDRAYITSTDIPVNTGYLGNMFIINNAANEKLVIQHGGYGNTAGAATAPLRVESVAKWINTSVQATSVQIINDRASADFNTVSTMKIWGSD